MPTRTVTQRHLRTHLGISAAVLVFSPMLAFCDWLGKPCLRIKKGPALLAPFSLTLGLATVAILVAGSVRPTACPPSRTASRVSDQTRRKLAFVLSPPAFEIAVA